MLYVPKLTCNLFSVQGAVAKGNAVEFGPNDCCIWDENGKGPLADKLLLSTLGTPQFRHLIATCGINVLDM